MSNKSVRELELIIQRLNSQLESKNEQIAELNEFIRAATDSTQALIRNFRAFCVKVLESELAYGDITSRDLEAMSLDELLERARNMLKQNQEKARSIYDTFKVRLTQKNEMIQGLTDQVSQLKFMIDNAEKMFSAPYEQPDDLKRTPAYLLDTDTPLEAIKPALAATTVVDEKEHVVSFEGTADKDAVRIPYLKISKRKIIFKEHLLQGLSGKRIFTDVAKLNVIVHLPEVFSPKALQYALGVSNGFAYNLVRTPGFPAIFDRNRIIVSKEGLIRWIRENEINH